MPNYTRTELKTSGNRSCGLIQFKFDIFDLDLPAAAHFPEKKYKEMRATQEFCTVPMHTLSHMSTRTHTYTQTRAPTQSLYLQTCVCFALITSLNKS